MTDSTNNEHSPLGKAVDEMAIVAAVAGGIGVLILAPGFLGLWLFDENSMVRVIVRVGALVLLVGITAFVGALLTVFSVGIPEYFGFRLYPAFLRGGALLISAIISWLWLEAFGILLVISVASTLWRERIWKRRADG